MKETEWEREVKKPISKEYRNMDGCCYKAFDLRKYWKTRFPLQLRQQEYDILIAINRFYFSSFT